MMEWQGRTLPTIGQRRIKKKFCWLPYLCQQRIFVWLSYRYELQVFSSSTGYDFEANESGFWWSEATLSPSQFELFKHDLAVHLTDSRESYRAYAELLVKEK